MVEKIIYSLICFTLVVGSNQMLVNTYSLVIQDRLAVAQLEDSDINKIALESSTSIKNFIPYISYALFLVFLSLIWNKEIKRITFKKERNE